MKQNIKPQPYTAATPAPLSPSSPGDKLSRELYRAQAYTGESNKSPRPSAQDKLQRERLRVLAGGASGSGPGHPSSNESRASLAPSYRSTSPSPTFTSLPPYSPGVLGSGTQQQDQPRERDQRKRTSLFRRFSRAPTTSVEATIEEASAEPLSTVVQNGTAHA